MDWKQQDGQLIAETDFGTYGIAPRHNFGKATTFVVAMKKDGETLLTGEYETISRATEAAETDLRHREKMWELL